MMWAVPDFVNESLNIYNHAGIARRKRKTSLLEEGSVV